MCSISAAVQSESAEAREVPESVALAGSGCEGVRAGGLQASSLAKVDETLIKSFQSLDDVDRMTQAHGKEHGSYYRVYLSGDRSAGEALEAARRLEGLAGVSVRQAHAYFVAAKRSEHASLAAACATAGVRFLLRDGHLRSGLKVVDYLLGRIDALPADDQEGFEGQWRILRAGIYNAFADRGEGIRRPGGGLSSQRSVDEYETVLRLSNGRPTDKAEAAFDMAALFMRDQRILRARQWFAVARELADFLPAEERERLHQAITVNLACVSLLSDPQSLVTQREEIEQLLDGGAPSQDQWTRQSYDAAEVLLGRILLTEGRLDEAIMRLGRAFGSSWQAGQAYTYAAAAYLLKGDLPKAVNVAETGKRELAGDRFGHDILLWKAQTMTILIVYAMVQPDDVNSTSPTLQTLYDLCCAWPSVGILGSRRPGVLGMLETFIEEPAQWTRGVLVKWLVFDILGIPPQVYRESRLHSLVEWTRKEQETYA